MTKHTVADTQSVTPSIYVQVDDRVLPVLSMTKNHLEMELSDALYLRAIVDVFEDGRLIFNALIDRVDEAKGAVRYVFRSFD